jgi:hypothetical protein
MSGLMRGATRWILGTLLLAVLGIGFPGASRADDVYTLVIKKQEQKQATRWSLSEWLETRDRMRLMDLWLALHTPSPYEFFISGAYVSGQDSPGIDFTGWDVSAAAFATIFGLEFRYDSSLRSSLIGLFDLRIFGYQDQGTNLTLQAGLRHDRSGGMSARNAVAGVRATIYLARHFGIEGLYRHFFDSTPSEAGFSFSGSRYEGGAFVDFSFVRVFGTYFSEPEEVTVPGLGSGSVTHTGIQVGTKLYF